MKCHSYILFGCSSLFLPFILLVSLLFHLLPFWQRGGPKGAPNTGKFLYVCSLARQAHPRCFCRGHPRSLPGPISSLNTSQIGPHRLDVWMDIPPLPSHWILLFKLYRLQMFIFPLLLLLPSFFFLFSLSSCFASSHSSSF